MPTRAEKDWMDSISQFPCCVCGAKPVAVHHILSGGRRIGHHMTLPLCGLHHASGRNDAEVVSRHPWRKEFERRYGKELELHAMVKALYENGQPA